jgi:hypothetical protein
MTILQECLENGNHLENVDDDGYCDYCGSQESRFTVTEHPFGGMVVLDNLKNKFVVVEDFSDNELYLMEEKEMEKLFY